MIGYLLLWQVLFAVSQARLKYQDYIFSELSENDPNWSPGFDIVAFRTEQLKLHNYYRNLHGVPLMTEDPQLTKQAQEYAEQEAAKAGRPHHCNLPTCDRHGAGENLAYGGVSKEINPTKKWYSEIDSFNYCHGGSSSSLRRPGHEKKDVGHFTQIVWKDSVLFGIGYAQSPDRTKYYIVARYRVAGNNPAQYSSQVTKPSKISDKYQDNCLGINGDYSSWSAPGKCSRSCGGGVRFQTRTCTNPKPSLNGRDCVGTKSQLAAQEWCNIQSCEGSQSHRDQQCKARGELAKSHIFSDPCSLYCYRKDTGIFMKIGIVDDGTHCNDDSGACVSGKCHPMPKYAAPTQPPPTNPSGGITGSYTGTPDKDTWKNDIFHVPNGATNVVITNNAYDNAGMSVGYYTTSNFKSRNWAEGSWMNQWVDVFGSYTKTKTVAGVTFNYKRIAGSSTITIVGPVQPTAGHTLVLFAVKIESQADISWTYNA